MTISQNLTLTYAMLTSAKDTGSFQMDNNYIIIGAVIVLFFGFRLAKSLTQISTKKAKELIANGAVLVDVRTSGEFGSGHIKGAKSLPLDSLSRITKKISKDKDVIVYCQSGARSSRAAGELKSMGYTKVHNLGGIGRWRD